MNNETRLSRQKMALDGHHRRDLVLIVEDESPIAEALALIIEDAGYAAITAVHGKEALDLAHEWHPDLIITDLMMPHLNGVDLIAAIHAEATASGKLPPPVVLMTAAGPARTRNAGANAVLRKPFDITEVEGLLQRFLEPHDSGK